MPAPDMTAEVLKWRRLLCVVAVCSTLVGWVCFCRAAWGSPGRVDPSQPSLRQAYVAALDAAAAVSEHDTGRKACSWWGCETSPLIHQLGMVGPPRSKFCKATRECIPVFDHYCPFLRHPVGRDNYAAFFGTILSAAVACFCLAVAAVLLLTQTGQNGFFNLNLVVLMYFGSLASLWGVLTTWHLFLAKLGLTTNEALAMRKGYPAYLVNQETGEYYNRFDRGCLRNLGQKLCPRASDDECDSGV
eukprot:gnl/TRDRNA2_/TRDRNA2_149009_c2_seq1.p1 gnl/TRDRNA2_/TRDRNA2_149009_c2~~gnl/TRDRNA2_/TRDRNA2_149009_c2_seq1.p1  ORF type:complete len:262 (-),score=28.15 gnl/TRDRNA2_/TRDRNA2_149009_c2_seq1:12-746(-)